MAIAARPAQTGRKLMRRIGDGFKGETRIRPRICPLGLNQLDRKQDSNRQPGDHFDRCGEYCHALSGN
jgi:hypothetical protein